MLFFYITLRKISNTANELINDILSIAVLQQLSSDSNISMYEITISDCC